MKEYYWNAMKDGELLAGMYTQSPKADSPEVCRLLAKPMTNGVDGWALVEKYGEDPWQRVVIEVVGKA